MPTRPPVHRPFRVPGVQQHAEADRGSASARGYDRLWRAFRAAFLADNPLCRDCLILHHATPAREVHHIVKLAGRPDLRLDPSNCMALCQSCHSTRTARGE